VVLLDGVQISMPRLHPTAELIEGLLHGRCTGLTTCTRAQYGVPEATGTHRVDDDAEPGGSA
jgi:hypothetical protein